MARILLVEDDEQLVSVLTKHLTNQGFEVLWANRMDQALILFRGNPVDLVITDFHIQHGSGRRLLNEVKKLREGTPVFLITGTPGVDEDALSVMRFNKVFSKPFSAAALMKEVKKACIDTISG